MSTSCLEEKCSGQSEDNWQFLVRKVRYISQMLRTAENRTFIDTEQQNALSVSICNCERGLRFADAIIVTRFQKRRYFTRNNLRTARKIESVRGLSAQIKPTAIALFVGDCLFHSRCCRLPRRSFPRLARSLLRRNSSVLDTDLCSCVILLGYYVNADRSRTEALTCPITIGHRRRLSFGS